MNVPLVADAAIARICRAARNHILIVYLDNKQVFIHVIHNKLDAYGAASG